MTENSKSTQQVVRDVVADVDLLDLINRQREAADILLSIARREEFDNPVASVRAASSAARMYSDVCAGLVVEERLAALQAEVDRIRADAERSARQGRHASPGATVGGVSVLSGEPVQLPNWGRPKEVTEGE